MENVAMMNSSQTQQFYERIKYLKDRVRELEAKIAYYEEHPEVLLKTKIKIKEPTLEDFNL